MTSVRGVCDPAPRGTAAPARGFTLLELMIVLVIIGILVSLAVPALHGDAGRRLVAATERLAAQIEQARQEAVLSSRVWRVVVEPAGAGIAIERLSGGRFEPVSGALFKPFAADPTIVLSDLVINGEPAPDGGAVHLYPDGEQDAFRVTLRGGGQQRIVELGPIGSVGTRAP